MRFDTEISRCKCPRCVAARRMRFAALIAVCITFACGAYLAFDLSHPRPLELIDLAPAPETLPHSSPSSDMIEAQPSPPPLTGQEDELITRPGSESVVSAASAKESWSTSHEPKYPFSPGAESPPALRVEATPIWAPFVTGIAPERAGNFAARPLSEFPSAPDPPAVVMLQPSDSPPPELSVAKSPGRPSPGAESPLALRVEATPIWAPFLTGILLARAGNFAAQPLSESPSAPDPPAVVMLQPSDSPTSELSVAKSPAPPANSEASTRENSKPGQNADQREVAATPSPKSSEPSVVRSVASAERDRQPGSQQQAGPFGRISLPKAQGRAQKAREIALDRSSASLYLSRPTPPPTTPPPEQNRQPDAPAPPPPVDTPSKSSDRDRGGQMDVGGDLRRFAASYVQEREKQDVTGQERYYAGSVHFYGEGDLSWTRIAAATRRYQRNSGQRRYSVLPANVRGPVDGGFWIVDQPYTWSKSDGRRVQTGKSVLRMRVIPSGHGHFKITSIEEIGR
jgi:hypothetical protein